MSERLVSFSGRRRSSLVGVSGRKMSSKILVHFSHLVFRLFGDSKTADLIMRARGGSSLHVECQPVPNHDAFSHEPQGLHALHAFLEPLGQNKPATRQKTLRFQLCELKIPEIEHRKPHETFFLPCDIDSSKSPSQCDSISSVRSISPSSDASPDASTQDNQKHDRICTRWMEFRLARDTVRLQRFSLRSEFWRWAERPHDIPYNPDKIYKHDGWAGVSRRRFVAMILPSAPILLCTLPC